MILGDVEETVTSIEIDEETYEEIYKVWLFRKKSYLFIIYQVKRNYVAIMSYLLNHNFL